LINETFEVIDNLAINGDLILAEGSFLIIPADKTINISGTFIKVELLSTKLKSKSTFYHRVCQTRWHHRTGPI